MPEHLHPACNRRAAGAGQLGWAVEALTVRGMPPTRDPAHTPAHSRSRTTRAALADYRSQVQSLTALSDEEFLDVNWRSLEPVLASVRLNLRVVPGR